MRESTDGYYSERLPDGRIAVFFRGKVPRFVMNRQRQARWDGQHYVTLSTRVPIGTARRFARACAKDGTSIYAALKAFVEDTAQRTPTAPPGPGGD